MFELIESNSSVTMSSYDFLNDVINPARMSAGERPIRNNDFLSKVESEIDDLGRYEIFVTPNNKVKTYPLNMEQMTLVGMRESKAVRRIVLQKLKELSSKGSPSLPNFNDPVAAARAWADQYEANQVAQKQLEIAAPKIDFVDRYVDGHGLMTFRQVCKLLNAKETEFRAFLVSEKIMYRLNGGWAVYEKHLRAGRFEHKAGINPANDRTFSNFLFTTKGVNWIAGEWAKFNKY